MPADCLVRPMDHLWSDKCDDKEGNSDSGISPSRSNSDVILSSPHSPRRPENSYSQRSLNREQTSESPPLEKMLHSPKSPASETNFGSGNCQDSPCSGNQSESEDGPLDRLKMALETSNALSGVYKANWQSRDDKSQKHQSKKEETCPLCAYTSPYRHRFLEHVQTHYADKCTLCGFSGSNANDLLAHLSEAHNVNGVADLVDPTDANSDGQEDEETSGKRAKSKTFKCKQCPFLTNTKLDFWEHTKSHIKPEKLLTCRNCPFVTEYKHHLEYHNRNHVGSKPFKCSKCNYTCVNKSMLNSHMKSHSNVYQYRCMDCHYATKYCHSLKLHLRKYNHSPDVVLDANGSPNPLPIIDVYGTRRGPKQKSKPIDNTEDSNPATENLPGGIVVPSAPHNSPKYCPLNNNNNEEIKPSQTPSPKFYRCYICDFCTVSFTMFNQHMHAHRPDTVNASTLRTNNNITEGYYHQGIMIFQDNDSYKLSSPRESQPSPTIPNETSTSPLDLSKPEIDEYTVSGKLSDGKKSRRKGKAYKLERQPDPSDMVEVKMEGVDDSYKMTVSELESNIIGVTKPECQYYCSYCEIMFKDIVMHTMHMGYHGYQDPFKCNMCGEETSDKFAFSVHVYRSPHT